MLRRFALLACLSLAACSRIPPPAIPSPTFTAPTGAALSAYPAPTVSASSTPYPAPAATQHLSPTPVRELADAFTNTPAATPTYALMPTVALPPSLAGLKIVMASEQRLVLWDNGTPVLLFESDRLESVYHPRFSPDGRLVAFILDKELWVIGADGKNLRKLFSTEQAAEASKTFEPTPYPNHGVGDFAWLPGNQTILFSLYSGEMSLPTEDLYRIDAQSGAVRMLLPPGQAGTYIYPSPDGKKVAMATATQVVLADPDGANRRVGLAFEIIPTYSEWRHYPALQWESDSRAIFVSIPSRSTLDGQWSPSTLWKVPVSGTARLQGELFSENDVLVSPGSPYLLVVNNPLVHFTPGTPTLPDSQVFLRNLLTGIEKPVSTTWKAACWTRDGRYALMDTGVKLTRLDAQSMAISEHPGLSYGTIICLDGTNYLGLNWLRHTYNLELASLDGTTYQLGPVNGPDSVDISFHD